MGVHVGLRAFDVEIRSTDGRSIVTLPRVYGSSAMTVAARSRSCPWWPGSPAVGGKAHCALISRNRCATRWT
jgi:hypothetical protein